MPVRHTSKPQGRHGHGYVTEESVNEGVLGGDSLVGIISQHLLLGGEKKERGKV